jgi:hypothetical protein
MRLWIFIGVLVLFSSCSDSGLKCIVSFSDTMGLKEGSPVRLSNGLTVSKVDKVEFNSDSLGWITAHFVMPLKYSIPDNSIFKVDPNLKGDAKILVMLGDSPESFHDVCEVFGMLPQLKYLSPGDSINAMKILKLDHAIQKIEEHFTKEPEVGYLDTSIKPLKVKY